ncbi:vasculin isoform X1 [Ascaphus truei]|uniref:vasculin isoform X1 n=1 Tax=Ascaphus truei TaxID=8439 RepID=UPI003F599FFC
MAQHDFAPAWLNFPTPPSSTKSSLNTEKHSETFVHPDSHYNVNRRRHNSSDAFDAALGRSNGGNFGRKEKNGWRSQGRNGADNINHRGTYNGAGSRSRSSTFHGGKSQVHHENNAPENDAARKEDRERRKQFEAEDFPSGPLFDWFREASALKMRTTFIPAGPSLNPDHERELNQNKSITAGVWEYPLHTRSRTSRMLVIRKGVKDEFSLSGYPIATSFSAQPVKNGMGAGVCMGQVPKADTPAHKQEQCKSQSKENHLGSPFCLDFAHESFSPNKSSPADQLDVSPSSLKEGDGPFSLHNNTSTCHERDINQNFDQNDIPQENENSLISRHITRSSAFPQAAVLSSSLEAEHRLLKEMGWQEDSENDETCAPLTEDEMREFQAISEQLQKNGLRKNGFLKNGLAFDFKFGPWKNGTFTTTDENEDTETSSSDTSDDDV